ncbi:sensor histidine kinase [Thalassotalea ganghwensis]
MGLIKRLCKHLKQMMLYRQLPLVLLVCVPCFLTAAIALLIANISIYLIAFILIILSLLCLYVVVASQQQADYQLRTISNIVEAMIDGDYSLRGRLHTNQAFGELLVLINELAESLAKHRIEAKESRLLLERIVEQMDAMVIATNANGAVVMANASAKRLIFEQEQLDEEFLLASNPIGKQIINAPSGIIEFGQQQLRGEHLLIKETFLSDGQPHQLYLLSNAERLLKEKERKSWQSLLRVLSHEMNNSLTPIATISQTIAKRLSGQPASADNEKLSEGIAIISERADALSTFLQSYSQLSHLPPANKQTIDINALVEQQIALFPSCQLENQLEDSLTLIADKPQLAQLLINVFKNADEAMTACCEKTLTISQERSSQWLHIFIADSGKGIANRDNLFVPFYTTKTSGSGIGLALCRQIMFNHDGLINLDNRVDGQGALVTLSFPLT